MSSRRHDERCLFCKIVRGEIPSARVLETDAAVAFLDIHPVNPGHVLLVARDHYATLAELPAAQAEHLGGLLPGLCQAVLRATGADGLNAIANLGRAAGQTIDHVHWHVIPRFNDDAVNWPWPQGEYFGDELAQMQFRIDRELRSASGD